MTDSNIFDFSKARPVQETSQSRRGSAVEAVANVAVGFVFSVLANWLVLPLFGLRPTVGDSFTIGLIFTAISLVRSYALRRFFNMLRNA